MEKEGHPNTQRPTFNVEHRVGGSRSTITSLAPFHSGVEQIAATARIAVVSTVTEIEHAIEKLPLSEKREVFEFLAGQLEVEVQDQNFPDLKDLLMQMPDVGCDADFARKRELPRDLDLS